MKKLFSSNLFYGILAVVLAVFLLVYVNYSENPMTDRTFPNIRVSASGLPDNHLLEREPGTAEIRVSGLRSALNMTSARDIQAFVDLRGADVGAADFPIRCNLPSGLSLVQIRPESVRLTVDVTATKEVELACDLLHFVAQGYSHQSPEFSPSNVAITGPSQALERIGRARISLDLTGRTEDYSGKLAIELLDRAGEVFLHPLISLSEPEASLYLGIAENLATKSVSVRTALSGTLGERYVVAGVEVHPSTVTISGLSAAISPIESLTTETIDLAPLEETFSGRVTLQVPSNVEVVGGPEVELIIRIEKNLIRRTIDDIPVDVRGSPPDQRYGAIPMALSLTLAAYPEVFEEALASGTLASLVSAYVDLAGQPADARDYPVLLDVPEQYLITAVSERTARLYPMSAAGGTYH